MKATDISTAVLNPNGDNCNISRFGASHGCSASRLAASRSISRFGASHGSAFGNCGMIHGSAVRFAIGQQGSKPGCAIPAKKPGLAPKRLICAASPNGGEEIAHCSPQEIMDEIAALDAESEEMLGSIKALL